MKRDHDFVEQQQLSGLHRCPRSSCDDLPHLAVATAQSPARAVSSRGAKPTRRPGNTRNRQLISKSRDMKQLSRRLKTHPLAAGRVLVNVAHGCVADASSAVKSSAGSRR